MPNKKRCWQIHKIIQAKWKTCSWVKITVLVRMSQSYASLSESDNDSDSGRSCSASSLYSKCLVGFVELKN